MLTGFISITWLSRCFVLLPSATFSLSRLHPLSLLLQSYWFHKHMLTHGAGVHVSTKEKNNPKESWAAEFVTCFLGRGKMLISAKALMARSLSLGLGRSEGETKLPVDLIYSEVPGQSLPCFHLSLFKNDVHCYECAYPELSLLLCFKYSI